MVIGNGSWLVCDVQGLVREMRFYKQYWDSKDRLNEIYVSIGKWFFYFAVCILDCEFETHFHYLAEKVKSEEKKEKREFKKEAREAPPPKEPEPRTPEPEEDKEDE